MTAPAIPAPALWLERRYDLAVALRRRRDRLTRRLARSPRYADRVRITRDLDDVRTRLTQLGDQD